ncbi:MAG: GspH/FimT family pseudopilin [Desulfobacterales bacterium]|nr:GspH/FimT family pseudopilin [Desulfobacterales bacterium]MBF0398175.1 GspH/FimT family pseudopilin [Desulfobacterales bacterium]
MRNKSGFTLTELMVVIGLIAILSGIAIPTFMGLIPRMKLNGAARQVFGDLSSAKMKAASLNRKVAVFFLSDGHRYEICDDINKDGTVSQPEGEDQIKDIQTSYDDVVFDLSNTVSNIVFNPIGTTSSSNSIITLKNSTSSKRIEINISGRIKIN